MTAFILPSSPFSVKEVDSSYEEEFKLLKNEGFKVYLINIDELDSTKIYPAYEGEKLIYRGWMLNEENYKKLNNKLNQNLIVQPKEYLNSHHIVNWYEKIKENTFETHFTDVENAENLFKTLQWKEAFIKDYVKSIKTGKGSIVDSVEDIERLKKDMLTYKGFIEGGLVFRKVEEFDKTSETRFFILNGFINAPKEVPEAMMNLAEKITQQHNAFFYTIDIIKQEDKYKVIEIGDGQVSDMVGWNPQDFIKIFNTLKNKNKLKIG